MSSVLRTCRVLLAPSRAGSAGAAASAVEKSAGKTKAKASSAGRNTSGITKPVQVSPRLASFLGVSESSRANAVKEIWAHIKLYNLQNPANKKEINCDAKLKLLFDGRDKVNFLEIAKLLSPHFVKTASVNQQMK